MSNFIATCKQCGESVDCSIEWPDDSNEAVVTVAPHTCQTPKLEYRGDYIEVPKADLFPGWVDLDKTD